MRRFIQQLDIRLYMTNGGRTAIFFIGVTVIVLTVLLSVWFLQLNSGNWNEFASAILPEFISALVIFFIAVIVLKTSGILNRDENIESQMETLGASQSSFRTLLANLQETQENQNSILAGIQDARERDSLQGAARSRRVFIVSSALPQAPFFSELIRDLIYRLESARFTPDLKLPQKDFHLAEIDRYIDLVSANMEEYLGGIVIHSAPERNLEKYKSFALRFGRPLVFLDAQQHDEFASFSDNCSFIGYDNSVTGVLAARFSSDFLRRNGIEEPKVLVLASKLQSTRQTNYSDTLMSHFGNAEIVTNEHGNFERRSGYKIVYDDLTTRLINSNKIWDIIFCTNDEMAIGASNAIKDLSVDRLKRIVVIGVDGIEEAKSAIEGGNDPLINTVDQNPGRLSEVAVKNFSNLLAGLENNKVRYLEPKMYISKLG